MSQGLDTTALCDEARRKGPWCILKSQIVTSRWGGLRRVTPYAFTEHGALMALPAMSRRSIGFRIEEGRPAYGFRWRRNA